MVPGDAREPWANEAQAHQILSDAEADLREWSSNLEPIEMHSNGMGTNLVPSDGAAQSDIAPPVHAGELQSPAATDRTEGGAAHQGSHLASAVGEESPTAA